MTITIASGKGGTGKTTFATNLAWALAERGAEVQLLDCDVEEPNDHLFLRPQFEATKAVTVLKPQCDPERCTACGKCVAACNYKALALVKGKWLLFNELCHSCGVCSHVCPVNAISERELAIGEVSYGMVAANSLSAQHPAFRFAHGLLRLGEALAPTVVAGVKELIQPGILNLIDAAPGTSCPVVAAVRGTDGVVLVTEPTPFGLNDLKLAVALTLQMGIPTGILVNRSDGEDNLIADYAAAVGLPLVGRIPFKREYAEAYAGGELLAARFPEFKEKLLAIYDNLKLAAPAAPPELAVELLPATESHREAAAIERQWREVTIISGKGGTGKTTIAAAIAHLAHAKVLADNDVDAADLHLLLQPRRQEAHEFVGGQAAAIAAAACSACGLCAAACHFKAIAQDGPPNSEGVASYRVEALACEGCGLCALVCPTQAITMHPVVTGHWFVSETAVGPMVHAQLGIGAENSGRLVTQVRQRAAQLASDNALELIVSDGPPGTSCPVIAAITGSDLALLVTEPTVSGVHDLERVLKLVAHFGVPARIIINKYDLNREQAARIDALAEQYQTPVAGLVPFVPEVNAALMAGQSVISYGDNPAATAIREAWAKVAKELYAT